MTTPPTPPTPGKPISASFFARLIAWAKSGMLIEGTGYRLRRGPNGTALDIDVAKSATSAAVLPWTFICTVSKDENGNETTVTKTVEVADPNVAHSIYSVVWCEGNTGWTRNAELNKVFLIQTQNAANDKLRLNGILTLNEVYDMLGVPRTAYGQIAGWVYTEDDSVGDGYVDFGIFNPNNPKACDFVNGYEKSIILDFNCIGNILEYI